jgi:hypothetical protein
MRFALCLLLVGATALPADAAGRRFRQNSFHGNGCYTVAAPSYYPQQTYQRRSVAEVLGAISEQKQAYDALTVGLATIFPQQYGGASSGYGSAQINETYGPSGNTQHAYQQLQHGGFGTLDVAQAIDRADRWANNALQVGAQAGSDLQAIVQTGVDGQVRVAEVLARGQVATAVLNAAAGQPAQPLSRQITLQMSQDASGNWQVGQAGAQGQAGVPGQPPGPPGAPGDARLAFLQVAQQSANQSCVSCHRGPEAKGGLDLTNLAQVPEEKWNGAGGIIDRLTTSDPAQLMPRGGDGQGKRLGNGVVKWWLGAAPDAPETPDGT